MKVEEFLDRYFYKEDLQVVPKLHACMQRSKDDSEWATKPGFMHGFMMPTNILVLVFILVYGCVGL